MSKHFYIYYSYEEFGRGYIGSRGCKCLPEEDLRYYGSFWDKTFKPTGKIILAEFDNRRDAYDAEVVLHKFYDVVNNPHFANQSRALTSGFTTEGRVAPNRGKKASEETRRKIGEASKGRKHTEDYKKKKSLETSGEKNPMYGGTHTPEAREKIGAPHRGKVIEDWHKERISQASKGKKHSEESKRKMREAAQSYRTPEYRKKISDRMTGRKISDETRERQKIAAKKRCEMQKLDRMIKHSNQVHFLVCLWESDF